MNTEPTAARKERERIESIKDPCTVSLKDWDRLQLICQAADALAEEARKALNRLQRKANEVTCTGWPKNCNGCIDCEKPIARDLRKALREYKAVKG